MKKPLKTRLKDLLYGVQWDFIGNTLSLCVRYRAAAAAINNGNSLLEIGIDDDDDDDENDDDDDIETTPFIKTYAAPYTQTWCNLCEQMATCIV